MTKPILIALVFVVATGVIGSVFSPENVINILGFCSVVTVSLLGLVKAQKQDEKLERIEETGEKVHILVNSNMSIQLKLGMELSEFKAATTNREEDIQAAQLAKSKYEEHELKQSQVDAQRSN